MKEEVAPLPSDVRSDTTRKALKHVEEALRDLRYGEITLKIQDGVVIQVDRTVKQRLPKKAS